MSWWQLVLGQVLVTLATIVLVKWILGTKVTANRITQETQTSVLDRMSIDELAQGIGARLERLTIESVRHELRLRHLPFSNTKAVVVERLARRLARRSTRNYLYFPRRI